MSPFLKVGENYMNQCGEVYHRNEVNTDTYEACVELADMFSRWAEEVKNWADGIKSENSENP